MVQEAFFEQEPATVFLQFQPMWGYIDKIREFCGFFCSVTLSDAKIADRVRVVVQELLENAIKYSEDDSSNVEVRMSLERSTQDFTITVMNHGTPKMVDSLQREIATMASKEPQEAYSYAMRRVARSETCFNRLGIARLHCEGQVVLTAAFTENGRIRVEAKGKK